METWKSYAIAAAVFAGLTSVTAKAGLGSMGADLGLAVRTSFVFGFVLINTWLVSDGVKLSTLWSVDNRRSILFLLLSALGTALSWVCYHRALKEGPVSYVALMDKGSILITVIASVIFFGEALTPRLATGTLLVLIGLMIIAGSKE